MQQVTLGGDRLGSGNKQQVTMQDYNDKFNSFNLEQDFKSSIAPGILYPFMKILGENHDTFDIDLDSFVRTIPTKGPLFGSFKLQLDVFEVPIRLYQGILHNNPTGIGLKMNQVYLPKLLIRQTEGPNKSIVEGSNEYNYQVNESALLKYLGLSGIGKFVDQSRNAEIERKINAVPALAYYDIFKCYYSNKQEENAYVITPGEIKKTSPNILNIRYYENTQDRTITYTDITPGGTYTTTGTVKRLFIEGTELADETTEINIERGDSDVSGSIKEIRDKCKAVLGEENPGIVGTVTKVIESENGYGTNYKWNIILYLEEIFEAYGATGTGEWNIDIGYAETDVIKNNDSIHLEPFPLKNIDDMRNELLSSNQIGGEFVISEEEHNYLPYSALIKRTNTQVNWNAFANNGLVVKTYQSDLFNNWLNTEYIDGENGIAQLSKVTITDGSFTMDTLNLAEKVYEVLNRIAVSGGTYEDWQEAVWGKGAVRKAETPMYMGGMSAEVMFEEVISNSETKVDGDFQALGSLGGKGTQVGKNGGNDIHIKCTEPCYIIGIASLTPRICYSQGNDWDLTEIDTLDDLHKPGYDGIGFQDLIGERLGWWDTRFNIVPGTGQVMNRSAIGKQTAWINYQTAVDKCYGDFAKQEGFSFMVLNRNYEMLYSDTMSPEIKDATTYIDPSKYNYAFAYTNLAAQNFWVQIHSKVVARRKMGAQQIPNL